MIIKIDFLHGFEIIVKKYLYFQKNKKPTQIRAFYPYLHCFLTYFTKKLHYLPCAF